MRESARADTICATRNEIFFFFILLQEIERKIANREKKSSKKYIKLEPKRKNFNAAPTNRKKISQMAHHDEPQKEQDLMLVPTQAPKKNNKKNEEREKNCHTKINIYHYHWLLSILVRSSIQCSLLLFFYLSSHNNRESQFSANNTRTPHSTKSD